MKRLVFTKTFGEFFASIAEYTHSAIKNYAQRHGADYLVLGETSRKYPKNHASWEDFKLSELLHDYDEIVQLDTDIIICNDTPWLLDVSCGMMCAVDESLMTDRYQTYQNFVTDTNNVPLPSFGNVNRQLRYFNLGVFGVTRRDAELWNTTKTIWEKDGMGHQTQTNHKIMMSNHPVRDLGPDFNSICFVWNRYNIYNSCYIKHFAGMHNPDWLFATMQEDIKMFKAVGRL